MYGMTPVGVFFTAIFPLVINGQALCQQLQIGQKSNSELPPNSGGGVPAFYSQLGNTLLW